MFSFFLRGDGLLMLIMVFCEHLNCKRNPLVLPKGRGGGRGEDNTSKLMGWFVRQLTFSCSFTCSSRVYFSGALIVWVNFIVLEGTNVKLSRQWGLQNWNNLILKLINIIKNTFLCLHFCIYKTIFAFFLNFAVLSFLNFMMRFIFCKNAFRRFDKRN